MARLSLRVDLDRAGRLGPGKVRLLEAVRATGSIAAAGRALCMSYRRACTLVENLNLQFGKPVVLAQTGGRAGGGTVLTPLGEAIVGHYRAIERAAAQCAEAHLAALDAAAGGGDREAGQAG